MTALLTKVRLRMAIHAHRPVRGLLEGGYGSVFKGRSLEFDDLRAYVPGDDVKDIDQRATARTGRPLIRRYVALRKHHVLLVVDTGRSMAALGDPSTSKRDLAVLVAGVMGQVAQRHGDLVGLVAGDAAGVTFLPARGSSAHLEVLLRQIHDRIRLDGAATDLASVLDHVIRMVRRRALLVIVSDDVRFTPQHERLLRRLAVQHEILHVSVGDLSPLDPDALDRELYDVDGETDLPRFLRHDEQLRQESSAERTDRHRHNAAVLTRLGIVSAHVTHEREVLPTLHRLLERQRRAGQR